MPQAKVQLIKRQARLGENTARPLISQLRRGLEAQLDERIDIPHHPRLYIAHELCRWLSHSGLPGFHDNIVSGDLWIFRRESQNVRLFAPTQSSRRLLRELGKLLMGNKMQFGVLSDPKCKLPRPVPRQPLLRSANSCLTEHSKSGASVEHPAQNIELLDVKVDLREVKPIGAAMRATSGRIQDTMHGLLAFPCRFTRIPAQKCLLVSLPSLNIAKNHPLGWLPSSHTHARFHAAGQNVARLGGLASLGCARALQIIANAHRPNSCWEVQRYQSGRQMATKVASAASSNPALRSWKAQIYMTCMYGSLCLEGLCSGIADFACTQIWRVVG